MMTHGIGKLRMALAGQFDRFPDPVGLGSALSLLLMTGAEFFCALAVILGAATRLAALPVVAGMAVAAFVVHGADPWTMERGAKLFLAGQAKSWASKEPALLYLVSFLALAFCGGGRFSVDRLLAARRRGRHG